MYNIYRGLSAGGIFYKLNTNGPLITNRYEERSLGRNPNAVYWYKVSAVYKDINNQLIEGPLSGAIIYQVNNTNRWFKKMNERDLWILKNTGELFDLYTRLTVVDENHPRCPKCYDPIRGVAGDPNCAICWGTGITGGYEPTIQLYVRQKPAQTTLDITPQGYVYNNVPGAWTISTIQIKNRDLLINPQGKLFSVTSSTINHAAGYFFHQELQLKELDPKDVLYNMKRVILQPEL
jgi:hypothetical protein